MCVDIYVEISSSFLHIQSSLQILLKFMTNLPMSLLAAYMVDFGLVIPCRFAGIPTNCSMEASLFFTKATTDGVVRAPSEFSITRPPVSS